MPVNRRDPSVQRPTSAVAARGPVIVTGFGGLNTSERRCEWMKEGGSEGPLFELRRSAKALAKAEDPPLRLRASVVSASRRIQMLRYRTGC